MSIYGEKEKTLYEVKDYLVDEIGKLRERLLEQTGIDPIEHCNARVKSEESMREKCRRKGLPETPESALSIIHDAIGIRVVCAFVNDVYEVRDFIKTLPHVQVIKEKDYIQHAKENGYRSFHMIILFDNDIYVEIQIRTISMDTWAALEHHLKYKKQVGGNQQLIVDELKRCADELASTDLSMQTIKDLIFQNESNR